MADGFAIDVERILERRPPGSTGMYGSDGHVDQARLAEFVSMFDSRRVLSHAEFRAALAARAALGTVPRRQFESLLALVARMNGTETITKEQFCGLFDNTLFWSVVSMPHGARGRAL